MVGTALPQYEQNWEPGVSAAPQFGQNEPDTGVPRFDGVMWLAGARGSRSRDSALSERKRQRQEAA
jgi:hypothetical protein